MSSKKIKINFNDLEFDVCLCYDNKNEYKHVLLKNYKYTFDEDILWEIIENKTNILEFMKWKMEQENPNFIEKFVIEHLKVNPHEFKLSYDNMFYNCVCKHMHLIYSVFKDDLYNDFKDYAIEEATISIMCGTLNYEGIEGWRIQL